MQYENTKLTLHAHASRRFNTCERAAFIYAQTVRY